MFSVNRVETIYVVIDVIFIYRHICIIMMITLCNACQNRDAHCVGRYAIDRLIGDRTWTGTQDDMSVSDFIRRISDDVISTYETATVENVAIKYYLEMVVDFQRTTPDGNLQSTSARFFIPPTTSDVENLRH